MNNRLSTIEPIGFVRFWAFIGLLTLSNLVMADTGLEATQGAFEWILMMLTNITIMGMSSFIIFKLWQIQGGQREWTEVIKPIVITALVIGVKVAAPLVLAKMGVSANGVA